MRQRVARVAVVAVLVALALLAVPLAVVIRGYLFADERGELEREALSAAVRVSPDFAAGDPVELPTGQSEGDLGIYDTAMRRRAGTGPASADAVTRRAVAGAVAQQDTGGELVVAVPVSSAEHVIGVVRASTSTTGVWKRVLAAWGALLAAALTAFGVALLLARHQARSLAAPLEALARTSQSVADGDLTARAAACGVAEIDQVAHSHNTMVDRLTHLLQHEREFTTNASHQLRTPLAGLQLGLETALSKPGADLRGAVEEALEQSHHLNDTIDEVLSLAKAPTAPNTTAASQTAAHLLERAELRWHGPLAQDGRRLQLTLDPAVTAEPLPRRTADQILDILLDNAHRHGRGTVEVTLRDLGEALAIDVGDEGSLSLPPSTLFERGSSTGPGQGIGLALATDLAQSAGGRLNITQTHPTRFTLLLPRGE
ncbi:HAMP domain-containing sensor histidine kinase [Streptomyces mauvecolor]|uniref:histidine kinase n=1 Tax=Streptomyces mauvecolor TaxID=58345 RepID=A0ABV9UI70_9ACTN